jgi:hypothetical protein
MNMQAPNYVGDPSPTSPGLAVRSTAPAPRGGLAARSNFDPPKPVYGGDPGGTGGGGTAPGTPHVIKRLTFTVLSPAIATDTLVGKSQPIVIAVPDGAKSYEIVSGFLSFPAGGTPGTVPAPPNVAPVGLDEAPKADIKDAAQVQFTVSWTLISNARSAAAGERQTLLIIEFHS